MSSAVTTRSIASKSTKQRKVLVLVGPTASGKTALSIVLARLLHGEILSADSRQMYRHMDIGTAKPPPFVRSLVPHHFIDELDPDEHFSAGEFGRKGRERIDEIFGRKNVPIVVGGSGLYVRALIDGFFEGPPADDELRKLLYDRARTEGNDALLEELRKVDPDAAREMLPSNIRRIVRALEVCQITGSTISSLQKQNTPANFFPVMVGLRWNRSQLYKRINDRVDQMIAEGFLEEVRGLQRSGFSSGLNALQTVGYREAFECLNGKISARQMIELTQRSSRQYAKRQLTWFRKDDRIVWFDVSGESEYEEIARKMVKRFLGVEPAKGTRSPSGSPPAGISRHRT